MRFPNLEIISIHIGKTGGSSFLQWLRKAYGEANVSHFVKKEHKVKSNDFSAPLQSVAKEFRIIHGHFRYEEVDEIHNSSRAKVITWVRDPVERVISRYFYLQKQICLNPNHSMAAQIFFCKRV